jgi:hypothetical protein
MNISIFWDMVPFADIWEERTGFFFSIEVTILAASFFLH